MHPVYHGDYFFMDMETRIENNIVIHTITGRLDGDTPELLRSRLKELVDENPHIIIDCGGLEYMGSMGLGVLVAALKQVIRKKGDIRIASPTSAVRMMLELTRTDKIFQVHDTVEAAVLSFKTP